MKKLIVSFIASAIGILIARHYVSGFSIPYDAIVIAEVAFVLAIINISIRPFLTFIFKPFIILTLGVLYFVIAAVLLWFVAYFFESITFASLTDLFYTAIIVSLTNAVLNVLIK